MSSSLLRHLTVASVAVALFGVAQPAQGQG
jgi:hypothetical protein